MVYESAVMYLGMGRRQVLSGVAVVALLAADGGVAVFSGGEKETQPWGKGVCTLDTDALARRRQAERAVREDACEHGDGRACVQAGDAYAFGTSSVDYARAAALYERGCKAEYALGCLALGGLDGAQAGSRRQLQAYRDARAIYDRACTAGQPDGCLGLASMLEEHLIPESPTEKAGALRAKAESLYQKRCAEGEAAACAGLGAFYLPSEAALHDEKKALSAFEKGCLLGEASSCAYVGGANLQATGKGERDLQEAATYFERACDLGDGSSCGPAGDLYERGRGVSLDLPRAARLYEKGCSRDDLNSCYRLAGMYDTGRGVVRDGAKAATLFKGACLKGCREACRP